MPPFLDDAERAALRASLGFADVRPADAFTGLTRQEPMDESALDGHRTVPASTPSSETVERIEQQLTELSAAVARLTQHVADLNGAEVARQLEELARGQRTIVAQLDDVRGEICRTTQAGLDRIKSRLDTLDIAADGTRRRPLDLLRRPNATQ